MDFNNDIRASRTCEIAEGCMMVGFFSSDIHHHSFLEYSSSFIISGRLEIGKNICANENLSVHILYAVFNVSSFLAACEEVFL